MADVVDAAQMVEEADRQRALDAARARHEASTRSVPRGVNALCVDCEEAIEPARLVALRNCTSRCASCATDHEQRMRYGR